jgi:alkylation response protein AidB-like acyl-CoA dehydrogenase
LGPLAARRYEDAFVPADAPCEGPNWPPFTIGSSNLFLNTRAATIYGGSREIQKNIIAKLLFGS